MQTTKPFVGRNICLELDLIWGENGLYPAFIEDGHEVMVNYGAQLLLEFPPNTTFDPLSLCMERTFKVTFDHHEGQEYLLFSLNEHNEFMMELNEKLVQALQNADAWFRVVVNPTEIVPMSVWDRPIGKTGQKIFLAFYAFLLLFAVGFTLWLTHS